MSYDLSFDRKTATLLAICTAGIVSLLVAAGFLLGSQYRRSARPSNVVPEKASLALAAPKSQPAAAAVPALVEASASASTPSASQPDSGSNAQSNPPAVAPDVASSASGKVAAIAGYSLQFGAFREEANAMAAAKKLQEKKIKADVVPLDDAAGSTWYTVRFGDYPTLSDASAAAVPLRASTRQSIFVRPANKL